MYDSWAIGTREACVKVRPGEGVIERESRGFFFRFLLRLAHFSRTAYGFGNPVPFEY